MVTFDSDWLYMHVATLRDAKSDVREFLDTGQQAVVHLDLLFIHPDITHKKQLQCKMDAKKTENLRKHT